jgi:Domain of unknown function (DUF4126)
VSALPLVFVSGWASGINCYAAVAVLGLLGRFAHLPGVPPTLERPDVLAVALVLFAGQFVVGKIPYLDSAWDVAHTAVRPVAGGVIGALMAHHAHGSLTAAVIAAALGAGTSLLTHLGKTGVRMGVNASPEPVSNSVASVAEDLSVTGMVAFGLLAPVAAAVLAAVLLLGSLLTAALLARRIRRAWHARRAHRRTRWPSLT